IAESCRRAHVSGGLSHRRPKIIVDQVPPASIRAAARDIACRASEVHVLSEGRLHALAHGKFMRAPVIAPVQAARPDSEALESGGGGNRTPVRKHSSGCSQVLFSPAVFLRPSRLVCYCR